MAIVFTGPGKRPSVGSQRRGPPEPREVCMYEAAVAGQVGALPGPDERPLRTEIRRDRLGVLYAVLDRAARGVESLPEARWSGLRSRLDQEIHAARARLDALDRDPAFSDEQILAVGVQVADLSEECLELVQGVGARDQGDDADGCRHADRLVAELVARLPLPRWDSLCVPGAAHAYQRRSRVIRVGLTGRLGRDAVWALPAVAHELGHQVAPLVTREGGTTVLHDVQEVLRRAGPAGSLHLSELFADCFATWLLGPAYGLWAARLGFSPGAADDPAGDVGHPPPVERLRQIALTTLALPDAEAAAATIEQLTAAGTAPPAPQDADPEWAARLDTWCDRLRGVLADRLGTSAYRGWRGAVGLAPALAAPGAIARGPERRPVADVLNAAWWARTQLPGATACITHQAWQLLV